MSEALRWWLILQLLGFFLLPLCLGLFARLPDRGYALSKPFGLLFVAYLFWLLNSLHLIPNSAGGITFALLALALVSGAFAYWRRDELTAWFRDHWRYVLGVEALFLVVFLVAVWLRMQVGAIGGTEQPMDLMYINAATRAAHFPPQDPWLSGHTVAYYYFGYLIVAMVGRMAGTAPEVSYNLGIAMIATLALVGATGIAYNLVRMHEQTLDEEDGDARTTRSTRGNFAQSIDGARPSSAAPASSMLIADASYRDKSLGDVGTPAPAAPMLIRQRTRRMAPVERTPQPAASTVAGSPYETTTANAGPEFDWARMWRAARAPFFALSAGFMLVLMGNLVGVLQFMSAYGIGGSGFYEWINVQGLGPNLARHSWYPSSYFGFFNASRIYPFDSAGGYVITEFPMFSFILGDLHPHVMALPFVLLAVGVALALYRSREPLDIAFWIQRPLALLAAAVVLGALAFVNTWDIATLAFVVVAAAAVSNFMRVRKLTLDLAVQVVSFAVPLVILAVVLYLPFYTSFTSQANGIGAVVSNRGVSVPGTRPIDALLFWGPLFAVVLPFVAVRLVAARDRITAPRAALACVPSLLVLAGWLLVFGWEKAVGSGKLNGASGLASQIADRGSAWATDAFFAGVLAAALLALWLEATSTEEREERESVVFTLGIISTALLLVLGCEFFYVGDVFNSRMNTVFKLYYQAWLLLAVGGGFALYYIVTHWRVSFPRANVYRYAWGAVAVIFIAAGALYTFGGTMDRIRQYDGDTLAKPADTLDGLVYYNADDRAGIDFLQKQAQGQDLVIAESVCPVAVAQCTGNDYTGAARISGATGIPTILGWAGHEDQWRGGTAEARAGRWEDAKELYTTGDVSRVNAIVQKYHVDYIYVGPLERTAFGDAALAKFQSLPVAFQKGTVTIYRATNLTGEVNTTP
ncbi:MAG TPA: DUF2298 domain-containing protein [Dehalococcoidia bacterium]|nr:DUF2298 domain-containing protein [Dehalococcoidia bacterium]